MRRWAWLGAVVIACAAACASAPPPAPPPAPTPVPAPAPIAEEREEEEDAGPPVPEEPIVILPPVDAGSFPRSTASFEQATSVPEPIVPGDDHLHLTDNQLNEPMRGVVARCRVPPSAKVTIKTAVQFGHAIGVTVTVELPRPKQPKKPTKRSKEAAKAHTRTVARLTTCADQAVRGLSWPPSRRRDAFTTTF